MRWLIYAGEMAIYHSLKELLTGIVFPLPQDISSSPIRSLQLNSQEVNPGDLFFALPGIHLDGRTYILDAINRGAAAVVYEENDTPLPISTVVPLIPVKNLGKKISDIAARFYHHPSKSLNVIGVTGTNGKTSISHFIGQALQCGVMGTMGNGVLPYLKRSPLTTLDAIRLQKQLAEFHDQGVGTVVMEVSSHALDQHRVESVKFDTVIFTNVTQDHLDYHRNMESYFTAKARLFQFPSVQHSIINVDNYYGKILANSAQGKVLTTSLFDANADLFIEDIRPMVKGYQASVQTPWGAGRFQTVILGDFNFSNLLAVLAVLNIQGLAFEESLIRLEALTPVPGRLEHFKIDDMPEIFVDYAHTPDALEKVLKVLRAHGNGKVWCVFGCGGNRDRTKRPMMGRIAEIYSDHLIITNDNPRTEDPHGIVNDILTGVIKKEAVPVIYDRKTAIHYAIEKAAPEDVILIAGKGHEDYQWIGEQRLPFDDRECVKELLVQRKVA